jgi:hypothetical protein
LEDLRHVLDLIHPIQTVVELCASSERTTLVLPEPEYEEDLAVIRMCPTTCINLRGLRVLARHAFSCETKLEGFEIWLFESVLAVVNAGQPPLPGQMDFCENSQLAMLKTGYAIAARANAECDPVLEKRAASILSLIGRDQLAEELGELQ